MPSAPPQQQPPPPQQQQHLPDWLDWPSFIAKAPAGDAWYPPAGSSKVPVGTMAVPSGGPAAQSTSRRKAVLAGLNYAGTPAELSGSHADVANMRAVLLRVDFPPEWILCLTDDSQDAHMRPTKRNLLAAMRWLTHAAAPGDALFFHFSGHSAQHQDEGAEGGEAFDDALCPADVQEEGQITDNQCFELLVRSLPAGVRLTVVIDTCLPCSCLELPLVCETGRGWVADSNPWHTAGDVICFGAAPDEELSAEALRALRGRPGGAITTALLQALHDLAARRQGRVTYLEVLEAANQRLRELGLERRLQLSSAQTFHPGRRHFKFSDAVPNGQAHIGLQRPRRHRSSR